jgi:hypothetical protein
MAEVAYTLYEPCPPGKSPEGVGGSATGFEIAVDLTGIE